MQNRPILFPLYIFLLCVYLHTLKAKLTVNLPKYILCQTILPVSVWNGFEENT